MAHHIAIPTSRRPDAPLGRLDIRAARATIDQRGARRHGLRGFQPGTTAALLALWELAGTPLQFLDVGANGGLYSWLCASLHPQARVVAFEPAPVAAKALRRICEVNGLDVDCQAVAVGSAAGEATLHLSAKSDASNSLVAGFRRSKGEVVVPVVALDDHISAQGLSPSVVKIDVEGYEAAALQGARRLLTDHRPVLVIELLPRHAGRSAQTRLLLEQAGYTGRRIETGHFPDRRDDEMRDWVFFPDGEPVLYAERFAQWSRVVARCAPAPAAVDAANPASTASSTS